MKKLKFPKYFNVLSVAALSACLVLSPITIHAAEQNVSQENDDHSSKEKNGVNKVNEKHSVKSLRFIGEKQIPLNENFEGTTVGGLSGIRYDSKSDTWVMISDDRSSYNPARFYNAKLDYNLKDFHSVQLTGVNFLKQADGSVYPNQTQYATQGGEVPDFESINIDPLDGSIWYTSEGDRSLGLNPFVNHATRDGQYLSTLPLPKMFKVSPTQEIGSRNNLSFEGSTFAPDGKSLWVAMEGPLYQDGPIPTTNSGALSRITQYDRKGNVLGQYAYPVDPIPKAPAPGKYADNGVSEILAVNNHELLTIERSGVQGEDGSFKNYIRIYEVDLNGASDIRNIDSLQKSKCKPVKKRLILDLNTLGLSKLDNIEGISWGPKLANGNDSLVLVSDNNFNSSQVTQFLAFEVLSNKAPIKN
ncbi:esterase-like activity of phytase family protein [Bacillus sp. S13(2024)]|uniref:esterase-like activity of phytase family protein n=1 Tax=unclassified Bacillus (in: firmicutes) TaxID=185979 RepID=UPI003D231A37